MKRKAKKSANVSRKEHVLSEAELKKIAAGFSWFEVADVCRGITDAASDIFGGIPDAARRAGDPTRKD